MNNNKFEIEAWKKLFEKHCKDNTININKYKALLKLYNNDYKYVVLLIELDKDNKNE